MKTSCLIRNILLAGSISLTLASCGGGGGGGGGESSSSGNDSTTNTPSTQKGYAPYNLSGCTMTYNHDGRPYTFEFDSSGKVNGKAQLVDTVINYTGTYTYSRSSDGQNATLVLNTTSGKTSSGIEKTQTFDIELSFSSSTQATALVSYTTTDSVNGNGFHENEDVYSVTSTFSGAGVQDNGSSDGESNDDTSSDDSTQLAPDSLPVGTVINLHANGGNITSYTLNSDTNCTNNSGGKLTWEYSVTGDNTAEWVARNALNIPLTYKLVFTSATGGTYTYVNAGGEASVSGTFNLSDKSDAPTQGNDDTSNDTNQGGDNTNTDNESAFPSGENVPVTVKGKSLSMQFDTFTLSVYFNSDGTYNLVFSSGNAETGLYQYTKKSDSEAEILLLRDDKYNEPFSIPEAYKKRIYAWQHIKRTFKLNTNGKSVYSMHVWFTAAEDFISGRDELPTPYTTNRECNKVTFE